jgi:hypothetical protein
MTFGVIVFRIETDRQQVGLRVNVGLLLQFQIDGGEVIAHQSALVRLRTACVYECERERPAFVLRKVNRFSVLIHQSEIGNFVSGFWLAGHDRCRSERGASLGHGGYFNPDEMSSTTSVPVI